MDIPLAVMALLVLSVILLYLTTLMRDEAVPVSSVVYHQISPYDSRLQKQVNCYHLIKTGLYYSFLRTFGTNRWCHWAVLCMTNDGDKWIISSTGHGSTNLWDANKMQIVSRGNRAMLEPPRGKHVYDLSKKVHSERLGRWLVEPQIYTPDFPITIADAINLFFESNRRTRYDMIGTNCQFVAQNFLHKYAGGAFPETDPMKIFGDILSDAFSGGKLKH